MLEKLALVRSQVDRLRWSEIKHAEIKQAERRLTQIREDRPQIEANLQRAQAIITEAQASPEAQKLQQIEQQRRIEAEQKARQEEIARQQAEMNLIEQQRKDAVLNTSKSLDTASQSLKAKSSVLNNSVVSMHITVLHITRVQF